MLSCEQFSIKSIFYKQSFTYFAYHLGRVKFIEGKIMDTFSNDSQVLFKCFSYHPISEALYDINGAIIDINHSMKKRYDITDKSLFFLNHLFDNTFLTDHQKKRNGKTE